LFPSLAAIDWLAWHDSAPARSGRKHRVKARVERTLSVVKAFSIAVLGAVQLKLDVEAAPGIADCGDPEQDLSELLLEIGEVAPAGIAGPASHAPQVAGLRPLARNW
jgi:hypothetical protein